ncbi:SMI1/KNR4 family protein [Proteus mirabilis]|uniref:SMI1/KNR4 family protein n=1 Tax=Proteus mirabilis TaxID=584 RepID=UPI0007CD304F|nr:SMI1/KNR4 family protein [Proteus mirabilis]MBG2818139.1 SMI1/KNR4 family protein [Proteus mirabilis]MBG2866998.1 SMI1/KNR4 family protein [Proteus mirabilis]MBG2926785.1 SMI1/KNR4 family protein [Proteus mirabilis]MBI6499069.1 SMI1/KNR4 family protein [Proteus mirabilis]MBL1400657.1 SMI1/KNR4 family protein [Proteus mirabilis]
MNKDKYVQLIESFSALLKKNGFSIFGCENEEVDLLEKKYGKLPEFYKIYLRSIGRDAGDFKAGTWMFYPEIDDINNETLDLMHQNHIIPPENMFAFLMHQGYTSLFFTDREKDDPQIYCYTECEEIIDIGKTFSQCIEADINEYLSCLN